ncbi:MAG TPA: plasmid mobilization relaxosome protein MobC [Panacibacter sp.]|nr:plasmid mobilization relaxosome protein MobC [Panacibacter sp.]
MIRKLFQIQNDKIVKKRENEVRKAFIKIRMNDAEIKMVKKYKDQTTERSLSAYMRKVSMQKPVTIKYRNQSADDFLKDMLGLKKELNAIGNNFNQAVHKLHLLDKIPEFRVWINHYESLQQSLVSKVEEIKLTVNKLYEEWLQK